MADLDNYANSIAAKVVNDLQDKIQAQVLEAVQQQIVTQVAAIDFHSLFNAAFSAALKTNAFTFPDQSIPLNAVNMEGFKTSGDNISGGIIAEFGSTGIDDKATQCQLSIFDETTVVENNLLTKDLTVKGTVNVEGDLNITGTVNDQSPFYRKIINDATNVVRSSLDQSLFQNYASVVFEKIKTDGIDLSQIKINGQDLVNGNNLSNAITQSTLQRVGNLIELQVQGESYMSGTLYSTKGRVGINTLEPSQALSIWDQEIEISFGKQSNNIALMGVPRSQTLIVSSNGKNNLTLAPDGSTAVNKLIVGSISITASGTPPSDNQPKGAIVFNSNPSVGGPMGWVSLGDAKWANFGIID
jgi:hypothetical protein